MVYIYLVLGCWLKFVFPETAGATDLVWQVLAWALIFAYALGAAALLFKWTNAEIDKRNFERPAIIRMSTIGLAALLSGHPIAAFCLMAGYAAFWGINKKRTGGTRTALA